MELCRSEPHECLLRTCILRVDANLTDADFSQANLTNAKFEAATLIGANLRGADARGAQGLSISDAVTTNLIHPNGHIDGLNLTAGEQLVIRDYDGNPSLTPAGPPITIQVNQQVAIGAGGTIRLVFEADAWDSTISFAPGIPVSVGGNLELTFADGVNLAGQIGRTFDLFDWTGVTPTGTFSVVSPYTWNLSQLYTTGEVTLLSIGLTPGDFDGDGDVDGADFIAWQTNFPVISGATRSMGDANGDGDVDGADLVVWQNNFPNSAGTSGAPVPEPNTAFLVIAAIACVLVKLAKNNTA